MGLTWAGIGEYAYFRQPTLTTGQRVYAWPTVAWTQQGAAWYVTARTGVHVREYDLNEVRPDVPSQQGYAIPISSVDAGVVLERDVKEFGITGIQTLEPRVFYVYVPYRNQSNAPMFDTAIDDFNFGQLFSVNRYLGNDRIGDANQLSLALTSRLLDPETGAERLRVAVGERFYFTDQRVVLNETPRSANNSDFLLGVEGRLSDAWSLISLWQYNFQASETERLTAGLRYTPAPAGPLNASYRYSRQNLDPLAGPIGAQSQINQWDLAGQWPVERKLDAARPLELLDPRPQDAGGGGRRRVQWRVLGTAPRRPAADDDDPDDHQLGVPADRAERARAVRHEPARSAAAQRPGLPARRTIRRCRRATAHRCLPGILRPEVDDACRFPPCFAAVARARRRRLPSPRSRQAPTPAHRAAARTARGGAVRAATPSLDRSVLLDRVVAIVNDEALTQFDIDEQKQTVLASDEERERDAARARRPRQAAARPAHHRARDPAVREGERASASTTPRSSARSRASRRTTSCRPTNSARRSEGRHDLRRSIARTSATRSCSSACASARSISASS